MTEFDASQELADWSRRCMGGPLGWRLCAVIFVFVSLWVIASR